MKLMMMVRQVEVLSSLGFKLRTLRSCGRFKFLSHCRCSSTSVGKLLDLSTKVRIEEKWSAQVNKNVDFENGSPKEKCYVCPMFPYPSGNLHMGHVRVYTISDAIARFHRLNGKNVLHPIGFDSFGLPAENAAIENKVDPEEWTVRNISKMRKQLKQLGVSFDWSREVTTSSPVYYKFTQHLFLLMYKHGLIYRKKVRNALWRHFLTKHPNHPIELDAACISPNNRNNGRIFFYISEVEAVPQYWLPREASPSAEAWVNWDPVDNTVLADEQVDGNGRSWRSGAKVEKKLLKQWFIRSTNFAESLRNGLESDDLSEWRDIVKLQKHWIGDCNGAEFAFDFYVNGKKIASRRIWVEKPEHVCRAEFVAVTDPSEFGATDGSELSFENPFTRKRLPVVVIAEADFAYPEGCDVKLCIPSQDERDAEVARKENIPFDSTPAPDNFDERVRICRLAITAGRGGHLKSSKLSDWLISRQRRWGTPIPIVHCASCGPVPVGFDDLPVVLPKIGEKPPSAPCPKCGQPGERETDTMDTFVDSSWYYLRYTDPTNTSLPFDPEKASGLLPVDVYIGGKEHATLHLYYARFVSHFLHSIGMVPTQEPFRRLLVQGMVMGKTYYAKQTKRVLRANEVVESEGKLVDGHTGEEVVVKWEKMSKSKHNGVEPSEMFEKFGVDTTRLLILGEVAPTSDRLWKEEAFDGILHFQDRLWSLLEDFSEARHNSSGTHLNQDLSKIDEKLMDLRNHHVKKITFNYNQSYQLSVAISGMQGLIKSLKKYDKGIVANSVEYEKIVANLLVMLAPMAPHFASELWSRFQLTPGRLQSDSVLWDEPVLNQRWPQLDDEYLLDVVFKVNNAWKGESKMPFRDFRNISKDVALKMALNHAQVVGFLDGREVLGAELSVFPAHSATLNIAVDHTVREKKPKVRARS